MKSLKLHLLVICILVSLSSHAGAANLPFGQTQTGTIGSAAQTNSYTFSANLDDEIDFTMVATSGTLSPKIQLYAPNGTLLISASPGFCSGSTIEMNTVQLPAAGTYTVLVGDCSGTNTGNYALYAQRTNNPSGAASLPFAQTQTGAIGSAAQSNTYTFSANLNDEIDFTMDATSGSLIPKIRLYEPNGALLSTASPGFCSGSTIEMNTVQIPATGTYTVLLGDCSDTNTGNYDIYTQRTDNPSGAASLPFGQTQTGSISSQAQDNTYTFSANLDDVVDFTMVTTSGKLIPRIRLYEPNGTLLNSASPGFCSGSTIEMNAVQLPASGVYTVLVGDCSDTNTGNYDIYAQRTNNPSGAAMFLFAQTQTGLIASAAQSNTYTFSANLNDEIDFTMDATSGSLIPRIRLYEPNGTLLSTASPGFCSGSTIEMNTVQIPATGTYTVLLGDCSDTNTGNYAIYAQSTNNPFAPAPVLWGQVQTGTIGSAAQSDTYTFSGTANNVVNLTMTITSGSLTPKMRLYKPNGTLLTSASPGFCSGSTTQLSSVTLPATGPYTLLVGDCNDKNTGSYSLSSQCFGTCPTTPAITWTAPAAITYGTALSATQLDATANEGGTFVYSPPAGTVLTAGPQTLATTFTPTDTTDYATATDRVQLLVNPATPTVTWPTPSDILVGTPLSATQLDATFTWVVNGATVTVPGQAAYNPPAGTVLPAGVQTLSVTFTPTDTLDYTTVTGTVQLSVDYPVPAISSLFPASAAAGSAAETLTINGTSFFPTSTVTYNGVGHAVPVENSTQLQIILSTSDLATPGNYAVVVTNPSPGGGTSNSVNFTVTGPVAGVSPSSLTFGNQPVGTASSSQAVKVSNTGNATLIASIAVSGDFAQTNNCAGGVAAGKSCTVNVTFTPMATGTRTGTLTITDNSNNTPTTTTVNLKGTGTAPLAGVSPSGLTFGNQLLGTTSASQALTFSNTGTATLTITSISASGDFSQTSTCAGSVAASSSCTINVTFTPTAKGFRKGTISIVDNAKGSPQVVQLIGVGTVVELSPVALSFGRQPSGTTSGAQIVTLTNTGNTRLNISGISITPAGDFRETNNCGASVAAGASCAISVTFTPRTIGPATAWLAITDGGGGGSPQRVFLLGVGLQ